MAAWEDEETRTRRREAEVRQRVQKARERRSESGGPSDTKGSSEGLYAYMERVPAWVSALVAVRMAVWVEPDWCGWWVSLMDGWSYSWQQMRQMKVTGLACRRCVQSLLCNGVLHKLILPSFSASSVSILGIG